MRDIKTLLTLLRDNVKTNGITTGLCLKVGELADQREITMAEYGLLYVYLHDHDPLRLWRRLINSRSYWWRKGRVAPRVRWLNKQINKLG